MVGGVDMQRILVARGEAAQPLPARRLELGGRRIGLGAVAIQEIVECDGRGLDVALDAHAGRHALDEVAQAAGHPLAAVVVENQRVRRDDIEVADEGAIRADQEAVSGESLDGQEVLRGARGCRG